MLTRRRPSLATTVAVLLTLAVGTQTGLAARSSQNASGHPQAVDSVDVVSADDSSITVSWPASTDNAVVAYGIYVNGTQVGTETVDHVRKWRDKQSFQYTIQQLACGRGYTVGVDAVDRWQNRSPVISTTVSTSACPDTAPPSAPTGIRQVAATETSVVLAWTPSTDNVGVVEYGLYASGVRVSAVTDANATVTNLACGTSYLIGLDAADAAGNRSARVDTFFRTSACPTANKPPTSPSGLKVTASTATSVSLAWSPSVDDAGVAGYGLYVSGKRTTDTTSTSASFTGLQCGTTYTLGVDAFDAQGLRSTVSELSAATSPCAPAPTSSTLTQTIAGGSTLSGAVNWRAVYDANGDNVADDPGSMRFLVDGTLVLTEQSMPFGDTAGFWASSTVADGLHTFEVRAVNTAGTVVATNKVSASVKNNTAPTGGDTTSPSSPSGLRVVAATATGVTIAWNAATDNVGVAGYGLYRGSSQTGQTQKLTASYSGLSCGTAYQVGVDAYDAAGNRSPRADLAVTTSPCADSQPPTAPSNLTVSTRTTTSIALTWAPSTDNVGVAGYGVYNGADLVDTTSGTTGIVSGLTCGTSYTLSVDAFDATGNSSTKTAIMVSTLACADTSAPTVTATSPTNGATVSGTVNAAVNATDNVAVTKVEFLRDGVVYAQDTSSPYSTSLNTTTVTNGSHTLGARAYDASGNVGTAPNVTVTVANSTPTSTGCAVSTPNVPDGPDPKGGCFPGPSNTGPNAPESSMTAYTGSCTVTAANVVIDSKIVNCSPLVVGSAASGLMITNSYLKGGVIQNGGSASFTIQNSMIDNAVSYPACSDGSCPAGKYACGDPNNATTQCGVGYRNFTILRTEIINTNRAAYCESNCLIQDSYFHGTNLWPDRSNLAHASSVRNEQYLTLKHNSLACDYKGPFPNGEIGCSADMSGYPDFAPIKNDTIDGNLFMSNNAGIGFCVYGGGTSGKPYSGDPSNATNIVFQNNVFQRGANGKCGAYGPVVDFKTGGAGNSWTNNIWDNGTAVNPG